jgi:16S rRNA (guanine966-N2)-methyltransferase
MINEVFRHRSRLERPVPGKRNSVRIIGGGWRGRRVQFPDSPGLRPTPDRVRETLFNWLQQSIQGTRCLDLFAGSGALGIEALSRGAREVVFVEQASEPARALSAELERLGGGSRARVIETAAQRFLAAPGEPFDGIFLDPPYGRGYLVDCVAAIEAGGWVQAGGWVYLESERTAGVPAVPANWDLVKSKSAGEVGYYLARIGVAPIRAQAGQ